MLQCCLKRDAAQVQSNAEILQLTTPNTAINVKVIALQQGALKLYNEVKCTYVDVPL